jgi:hypothetical protein
VTCIVVEFVYPPIPIRSFDWLAYEDGREESGPFGTGPSREAAVADLFEALDNGFTGSAPEPDFNAETARETQHREYFQKYA